MSSGSLLVTRLHAVREGVIIALDSIRANKVRAGLTILGIAVGVFVVVLMAAAIHGINQSVAKDFESTGPTTFFVSRYPITFEACDGTADTCKWLRNPRLTLEDAEWLSRIPSAKAVGARLDTSQPVRYKDRMLASTQVIGFTPNWPEIDGGGDIYPGRSFTNSEAANGEPVVIINDEMAKELFGESDPIDKVITIGSSTFKVIGLYHYSASFLSGGNRPRAIIPIEAARRRLNVSFADIGIAVKPRAEAKRDEVIDEVIASMRDRRSLRPSADNNFAIITQDQLFDVYNKIFGMFFLVMIVLSAIGLLVGGVGVVAIMMISVTERTREIGVRKALGATRGTIMWQFLVEAVTLTGVGAIIGLILGTLGSFAIRAMTPVDASVPPLAILAALVTSALTGVLFGVIPALKASKLDPVTALRYE